MIQVLKKYMIAISKAQQLKMGKKKKVKKVSRKALVKKLDSLVSKIVIKRDGKCMECGSLDQPTCGHVFSRSHYSTRWDLENCWCQCWPCNYKYKVSDTIGYYLAIEKVMGREKMTALYDRWKTIRKWTNKDLQELYDKLETTYESI